MKKIFNRKNSLLLFILSVLLFTGSMFIQAPTANAATDTVSMYYDDINCVYHGGNVHNIYIKVANLDYEKNVSVHYTFTDRNGTWYDEDAEYVTSLDSDYDIFKATISGFGTVQYSINYTVDGETYVDDNDGDLYSNQVLGSASVCALRSYGTLSSYPINAAIRDYGTDKDVKVIYTTDNWTTVKEASLSYSYNTGEDGVVVYYTSLNLEDATSLSDFEYAIAYTTNGVTYWDSNFGSNYDSSHYSEY